MGKMLSEADKSTIERVIKETQEWLESHLTATTEEYQAKQKECETSLNEIITRMYSQNQETSQTQTQTQTESQSSVHDTDEID